MVLQRSNHKLGIRYFCVLLLIEREFDEVRQPYYPYFFQDRTSFFFSFLCERSSDFILILRFIILQTNAKIRLQPSSFINIISTRLLLLNFFSRSSSWTETSKSLCLTDCTTDYRLTLNFNMIQIFLDECKNIIIENISLGISC